MWLAAATVGFVKVMVAMVFEVAVMVYGDESGGGSGYLNYFTD